MPVPLAVVSIDAGTTAVKVIVLGLEGSQLGAARSSVTVCRPDGERAEQDMDQLWHAVADTVKQALQRAGTCNVIAVSVTGQGDGMWLVDDAGRPTGPAACWLDGHAADVVHEWSGDGRAQLVTEVTGSALFPGALPVLLERLRRDDPGRLARSWYHLNCKDWIRLRLTAQIGTDLSDASRTYLDPRTGRYSDRLLDGLGHRSLARLLPPVLPAADVAGTVTPAAQQATDLPVGVPVITGVMDTAAAALGLGAVSPGDAYAIVGTTSFMGVITSARDDSHIQASSFVPTGVNGLVIASHSPMTGAPNFDWACQVTAPEVGSTEQPEWSAIETQAAAAGPGASGVLYLPYLADSGERAPFVDPAASAAWLGLSVRNIRGHLLRAVYEGLALTARECLEQLRVTERITVCGGAAASDLLCQVLADVTGVGVARSRAEEVGARGVAALAVATVQGESLAAVVARFRGAVQCFLPDPAASAIHDRQSVVFAAVRDALRPAWPGLRSLRTDPSARQPRPPGE